MKRILLFVVISIVVVFTASVDAKVKMPAVFSDNMVLQRNSNVTLWGWAEPQELITIEASWGEIASVIADENSKWSVSIKTSQAGGPYSVMVKGKDSECSFANVMLGEVWICSGQSNMEMSMSSGPSQPIIGGPEAIAQAKMPNIRLFTVKKNSIKTPQEDCEGTWVMCSPETVAGFSAAGYFFGKKLYDEIKVPIGLIHTSWGGSSAEAWIRTDLFTSDAEFEPMIFKFNSIMSKWESDVKQAQTDNKEAPNQPVPEQGCPSYLYNGMIKPLVPYTVKGVIWYQGESNGDRGYQYGKMMPMLIQNWRQDWGYEMSFYLVQLANYVSHQPGQVVEPNNSVPAESYWAELREAQLATLTSVPKTGMAVAIDIGEANNIHPGNKKAVGERLAYWALAKDYGKEIVYSGPLYKSMTIEKAKKSLFGLRKLPYSGKNIIRIKFDYADGGLVIKGDKLTSIAIAGADRKFVWAEALIVNDELIVWSDAVKDPVAVRYGWAICPAANLYNKSDLPASPFRTDKWFTLPGANKNY